MPAPSKTLRRCAGEICGGCGKPARSRWQLRDHTFRGLVSVKNFRVAKPPCHSEFPQRPVRAHAPPLAREHRHPVHRQDQIRRRQISRPPGIIACVTLNCARMRVGDRVRSAWLQVVKCPLGPGQPLFNGRANSENGRVIKPAADDLNCGRQSIRGEARRHRQGGAL